MGKLSIIIPVYNEARTILEVLNKIRRLDLGAHDKEVIIVDGDSTDGTRELLRALTEPWVWVIYEDERRGKGIAVADGIKQASGDCVIIQDADSEYDPRDIPALVMPVIEGQAQVVYGSRFMGRSENMTLPRRVANRVLTFSINRLYGARLTDACTCYKALNAELARSLDLESATFDVCHEITAKVLRRGYHILELPIHYQARNHNEGVKSGWVDFLRALYTALKYRFKNVKAHEEASSSVSYR